MESSLSWLPVLGVGTFFAESAVAAAVSVAFSVAAVFVEAGEAKKKI